MTPKEKAEELYWKYAKILYLLHDVRLLKNSYAKDSALIAVDEILKAVNNHDETFLCKDGVDYWMQVKQEIENL